MTLGGGGHPGAGGCHLDADLETTKERVVRALGEAFNRSSARNLTNPPTDKPPT